ncbi:hypothetical protein H4R18_004779 [Coemansia javaensis]|uniref:J domain-containing protein n=1 Tax=Coemansia javaensis TaxID=2761396 RepID=A0A9W8H830_9FUNG|nr:hypothetical protein H4R18_004779 [Coemansia javaensis]
MPRPDDASERTLGGSGGSPTGLYAALGVERDATADEIKRAYRRLALQHHPDRNHGAAASSTGEFVRIQYAYDVLSDARRRRIYDRYGEMGVRMAGRVGGELLDPLVSGLLSALAFALAAVALLLIAFFALLARRVDRANEWPFAVIFAPLWAVDLAVLAALVLAAARRGDPEGSSAGADEGAGTDEAAGSDSSSDDEPTEPSGAPATDATPLLAGARRRRRRLRQIRKRAEAHVARLAALAPVVYMLLLIGFQVSLVLRLDRHVGWSALRVAAPWFCIEAVHGALLTLQLATGVLRLREQPQLGGAAVARRAGVLAANTYWWLAIRVALGLLVIGKLGGALAAWSWALVFAPAYLPALRWAVALGLLGRRLRASADAETRQNARSIVVLCAAAFGVAAAFVYSFVALVAWRLTQPLAVRLALVFVPVFVALALVCCCCSCVGLCLAYGIDATLEDEAAPAPAVPAARRISQ